MIKKATNKTNVPPAQPTVTMGDLHNLSFELLQRIVALETENKELKQKLSEIKVGETNIHNHYHYTTPSNPIYWQYPVYSIPTYPSQPITCGCTNDVNNHSHNTNSNVGSV